MFFRSKIVLAHSVETAKLARSLIVLITGFNSLYSSSFSDLGSKIVLANSVGIAKLASRVFIVLIIGGNSLYSSSFSHL